MCYHEVCQHPCPPHVLYTSLLFFDAQSCISAPLAFRKPQANDHHLQGKIKLNGLTSVDIGCRFTNGNRAATIISENHHYNFPQAGLTLK